MGNIIHNRVELEPRELEPRELGLREPGPRAPEPREQGLREPEARKPEPKEQESKKQELKEQEPKEQELKEQEPKKQELKEQEPKEQEPKEQKPKEQKPKEQEPKEQERGQQLSPESIETLRREVARDKRPSRRPDIMLTFLVLVLLAGIGFYLYRSGAVMGNRNPELDTHVSVQGYVVYDLDGYVNEALTKLASQGQTQAVAYEAGESSQRKAALIFYGFGTGKEMDEIVRKLNEYEIPAMFFADAMTLAENRDLVDMIRKNGYPIGTCGFDTSRQHELLSEQELVTNLAKAKAVFSAVLSEEMEWYYGLGTEYTEELLQAIPCAGVRYAVKPSCFISSSSFPSFSAAAGFLGRLDTCEVICVKISAVLEAEEYQPYEVDAQVEIDKAPKATLPPDVPFEQPDIVNTVGYLVEALDALQIPVVPVSRIGIDPDPEIAEQELLELPESPAVVAEGEAAGSDYFDGVLMIGDSITQSLSIYGTQMRDKATICAYKSITPDQIVNNVTTEDQDGNQIAVLDEIMNQSPHAIYIMLGMNSLASGRSDNLVAYYGRLIDLLREAYPDVPIYIQSITPVTLNAAIENIQITNRRIRKTNQLLIQLAEEKRCWYLDLYSAFSDEEGNMLAGIHQPDGIHLKAEGCQIWMDYLLTHVATQEKEVKTSLFVPRQSKRGEALWIG